MAIMQRSTQGCGSMASANNHQLHVKPFSEQHIIGLLA
jgi:hypothetical protein